jgi:predicted kinase
MLIVFGGLPGTGKTTIALELVRKLCAFYLRIDTIEQAIVKSGVVPDAGTSGYFIAYAVAMENLRLGSIVVADSVNALNIVRDSWIDVAEYADVSLLEIEIVCSDTAEHQRRIESRQADRSGHAAPTWQAVLDRKYDPWAREHMVLDTATLSVAEAVEAILHRMPANSGRPSS